MNAFQEKAKLKHIDGGHIRQFHGRPDCSAFYSWVLNYLNTIAFSGHPPPSPPLTSLTNGQKGNLGELISYLVSREDLFKNLGHTPALAGALIPFQPGTAVGLDIMVVYLDPNGNTNDDRLYIQEVKATGATNLTYADALVEDYKKLLDDTNPSTTLPTRVSAIKAKLYLEHGWSHQALQRVEDMVQPKAKDCTKIRLMPTLVHDLRYGVPSDALGNVLSQINLQGWPAGSTDGWSIAITRLNEALIHLANRVAFAP